MNLRQAAYGIGAVALRPVARMFIPEADSAISILMFHGIHESGLTGLKCPSSRNEIALENSIRRLAGRFRFVSIDEAINTIETSSKFDKPAVVLTFDDSLKSSADRVAPMLQKLGIPATFYLSTEVIDKSEFYWWHRVEFCNHYSKELFELTISGVQVEIGNRVDISLIKKLLKGLTQAQRNKIVGEIELQLNCRLEDDLSLYPCAEIMSWDDAAMLAKAGFTLGNHTVKHENLTLLERIDIHEEVVGASDRIKEMTGVEAEHLCYPYGLYDERVERCVSELGVRSIVTVSSGWNNKLTNPFRLKRVSLKGAGERVVSQLDGTEYLIQKFRSKILGGRR